MDEHHRIESLVTAGRYHAAILELARALRERPGSVSIRQRLADVLVQAGRRHEAAGLLVKLAEEFAADGFTAKAIATVKKVQRIDRRRPEMAARLAELIMTRNRELGIAGDDIDEAARSELLRSLPSLQRSPLVSELTSEELVVLIQELTLESFDPDEIVFSEGDEGDCLYLVAGGSARVLERAGGPGEQEVGTLGYGDLFGETALLGCVARTATVKAATALDVLTLSRDTFDALAAARSHIAEALRRFVERQANGPEE